MKLRVLGAVLVAVVVALVVLAWPILAAVQSIVVQPGDSLAADCSTGWVGVVGAGTTRLTADCPLPTPTPTAMATTVPAASPTPTNPGGLPDCPHTPTVWHALVERAPDGTILCTYGHEHKDSPRPLDGVFGPLAYGEISYPWETHQENANKHRVYGWHVVDVPECRPSNEPLGFRRIRLQAHQDGNGGAAVRFHSYLLQAEACDPSDPAWRGTISIGGHLDYGILEAGGVRVFLAGDPLVPNDNRRIHGSPSVFRPDFTWYGATLAVPRDLPVGVQVGLRKEDWGPVDPLDPHRVLFYGGGQNGSYQDPAHVVSAQIGSWLDALDGVSDGRLTYTGYTDRYGNVVTAGCSPATVGADCVPFAAQDMKVGRYQFRVDANGLAPREYDVRVAGQSLIRYPN